MSRQSAHSSSPQMDLTSKVESTNGLALSEKVGKVSTSLNALVEKLNKVVEDLQFLQFWTGSWKIGISERDALVNRWFEGVMYVSRFLEPQLVEHLAKGDPVVTAALCHCAYSLFAPLEVDVRDAGAETRRFNAIEYILTCLSEDLPPRGSFDRVANLKKIKETVSKLWDAVLIALDYKKPSVRLTEQGFAEFQLERNNDADTSETEMDAGPKLTLYRLLTSDGGYSGVDRISQVTCEDGQNSYVYAESVEQTTCTQQSRIDSRPDAASFVPMFGIIIPSSYSETWSYERPASILSASLGFTSEFELPGPAQKLC